MSTQECPVCLEEIEPDNMFTLSCQHEVCVKCTHSLFNLECPLCRRETTNYPEDIKNSITRNAERFQRDTEEEDRIAALEYMRRLSTISIKHEIKNTLNVLRSKGFPIVYLPKEIRITHQENNPPDTFWVTDMLIQNIVNRITQDYDIEWLDAIHDETIDDDNPFIESDRECRNRPLKIYVNDVLLV